MSSGKKGPDTGSERPILKRSREEAQAQIEARIAAGEQKLEAPISNQAELTQIRDWYYTWHEGNRALLRHLFTTDEFADRYYTEFLFASSGQVSPAEQVKDLHDDIRGKVRRLAEVIEQLPFVDEPAPREARNPLPRDQNADLMRLLKRFDRVARQLRSRHQGRTGFEIEDEYDVQDLLAALLRIDFDDVRSEEWVPSYGGGASRVDFLLKDLKTVVECKKTRASLTDANLGAELIVDAVRYRAHPDCDRLVCLIYDPEGRIANPDGLARDLEAFDRDGLTVSVVISPAL